MNKADEISAGRSSKVPKLEGLELHSLLMDDPPAMEISNASMGLNAFKSLMDVGGTLPIDILLHDSMDLLDDKFFLQLLKLRASGVIAYGAFAPACREYSRLKLKPGGPKPLRLPDRH